MERQQIMVDLMEIEASLQSRKRDAGAPQINEDASQRVGESDAERRQHPRIVYRPEQCPVLAIEGRSIPILDVSTAGIRLEPDAAMADLRILRGAIAFSGQQPVRVTGKVVRKDDHGLGVKLVTRIGKRILDQECMRLSA